MDAKVYSPGRVLIIDDEAALRSTLQRVLQTSGIQAEAAGGGEQALARLAEQHFDLVFLDLHLPGMDGIQILTQVRKLHPKLPVVVLTGYGTMQSAVEALRLGAADYLLKPFDPQVLTARTHVMLAEQHTERKKDALRRQIGALQAELAELETQSPTDALGGRPIPADPQQRFVKLRGLVLDLQARRATLGAQVLNLPPAAFDYLAILARYSPNVVRYAQLVSAAQNYQVDALEARALAKYYVYILRQALEEDPQNPRLLLNVRGIGYKLLVD